IHLDIPNSGAEAHVKGAHLHGSRFFTIKVASGSYANPDRGLPVGSGIVLVFDSMTGFPRAVLFDNGYLTDLRTGAAGALAADLLANREVHRVGIVGVGTQARYQLAALLGVRTPERVIAFGRSEAKATAFAQEMEKLHRIRVLPAKTVEQAVRGSDVVITVTPSREPLVRAEWIGPGTHVTAVGADGPDKQELEVEVLKKADKVVADRLDQCVRFGEIHHAVEAGVLRPAGVYARHGSVENPRGIDVRGALRLADAGVSLESCGRGISERSPEYIRRARADTVIEVTPLRIAPRQVALDHLIAALRSGKHVITANKGPVVYHYRQLRDLARLNHVGFRYEGTVMDGAPVFNLFQEALRGARLKSFEGILNSTTNLVLSEIEAGR